MARTRKIGILTFHRCINYGSYWQARCLVEGLRARGHDAVLLDHHSRAANWAEWRCALEPLLPQRSSRGDHRLYASKARKFRQACDRLPRSASFPLENPALMERYDLIVVGSDEVWNLSHPWYGGRSAFFGHGLRTERLVSYAASFGNYDVGAGLDGPWREWLQDFESLSVRDENSRQLVRDALGEDPSLVLDPCLQFPPAAVPPGELPTGPYVAVYGHSLPGWFVRQVRAWAAAIGCSLVSIGYRNAWADEQRLAAGPEEFPRLIANAAAVVTNFFHGCVFALLHARPFACAPSPYRFNKLRDLTQRLGAGRHWIERSTSPERLPALLGSPIDEKIQATIARMRRSSDAYVDRVLA